MGYIFSAFGWAYVIFQLPGGWLLDKFGSKKVYAFSIFFWSLFTLLVGAVGFFTGLLAIVVLFSLRFLVGAAEAPSFPANSRIVAAWFPANERGTAAAIFNSAQYAATVVFAPLMGWLIHSFGWHWVFAVMGVLGMLFVLVWNKLIFDPKDHPMANTAEVDYIEAGGGLVSMDQAVKGGAKQEGPNLAYIKQLLSSRMLVGIYIAQYCINALTYFFITWFPVYLVQEKHMTILKAGFVAAIPAVCGFVGGVLGGIISDFMLRRGFSLTAARKTPIVAGHAAVDGDGDLQLRFGRIRGDLLHGALVLRQGDRRARLGRQLGHGAQADRRASPAACSTSAATCPASPRRSQSATSSSPPGRSTARWCTSSRTPSSR